MCKYVQKQIQCLSYLSQRFITSQNNIKKEEYITRCFNEKEVNYISINNSYRASWTNNCNGSWHLKCTDIIKLFSFLMNNIYVKFQGRILYKEVIVIVLPR